MKRRLTVIAVFLLIGAAVNVAVAWSMAFLISLPTNLSGDVSIRSSRLAFRTVCIHSRSGAMSIVDTRAKGNSNVTWIEHSVGDCAEAILPAWFEPVSERFDSAAPPFHEERIAQGRGWPLLSMRWDQVQGYSIARPSPTANYHFIQGLEIPAPGTPGKQLCILPLRPIGPGFVVNTALYAAISWLLFAGPFALHRRLRRRRGCCLKCGYDLRGSESSNCSECGATRAKAAS